MYIQKQVQQCLILPGASWPYHYTNTLYLSRLISHEKGSRLFCFVFSYYATYFGNRHFRHFLKNPEKKAQAGWYY